MTIKHLVLCTAIGLAMSQVSASAHAESYVCGKANYVDNGDAIYGTDFWRSDYSSFSAIHVSTEDEYFEMTSELNEYIDMFLFAADQVDENNVPTEVAIPKGVTHLRVYAEMRMVDATEFSSPVYGYFYSGAPALNIEFPDDLHSNSLVLGDDGEKKYNGQWYAVEKYVPVNDAAHFHLHLGMTGTADDTDESGNYLQHTANIDNIKVQFCRMR